MITLETADVEYKNFYKKFYFPSGEMGIELADGSKTNDIPNWYGVWPVPANLYAEVCTADDLMELLLVVNALKHRYPEPMKEVTLILPYIPFGRQDRHTTDLNPFSLRVLASLINSMGFPKVITYTPHSQATELLIDNLVVDEWKVYRFAKNRLENLPKEETVIVAPDAGAEKRAYAMAKVLGVSQVIVARKDRDPATGVIRSLDVSSGPINAHWLVVDDICDGGATFLALEKALKCYDKKSLTLFVTHGIFSKGRKVLYDAGYDHIVCFSDFIERRLTKCSH